MFRHAFDLFQPTPLEIFLFISRAFHRNPAYGSVHTCLNQLISKFFTFVLFSQNKVVVLAHVLATVLFLRIETCNTFFSWNTLRSSPLHHVWSLSYRKINWSNFKIQIFLHWRFFDFNSYQLFLKNYSKECKLFRFDCKRDFEPHMLIFLYHSFSNVLNSNLIHDGPRIRFCFS